MILRDKAEYIFLLIYLSTSFYNFDCPSLLSLFLLYMFQNIETKNPFQINHDVNSIENNRYLERVPIGIFCVPICIF